MISRVNSRHIGLVGEAVACKFLEKRGFEIVMRNYRKKWGEIDIIARMKDTRGGSSHQKHVATHFFEVKSVTKSAAYYSGSHTPEENVHWSKTRHIGRMIQTYQAENREVGEFYFHVLAVTLDMSARKARVRWLKDIIL